MATATKQPTTRATTKEKWLQPRMWYLIPARFVGVQIGIIGIAIGSLPGLAGFGGIPATAFNYLGAAIIGLGGILVLASFLAIIPLLYERKRLHERNCAWAPGIVHYLIAIPGFGIGILLSMLYTYNRLKWVGPSSQKL